MAYNKPNSLERELLIKLCQRNLGMKLDTFCMANVANAAAFKAE